MGPHRLSRHGGFSFITASFILLGCASDCPPGAATSQGGGGGAIIDAGDADADIPFDFPPCRAGFTNLRGTWRGAPFERSIPSEPPLLVFSHHYLVNADSDFDDATGRPIAFASRLLGWDELKPDTGEPTGFNGALVFPDDLAKYSVHEKSSLFGRWPVVVYQLLLDEGTLTGCSQ